MVDAYGTPLGSVEVLKMGDERLLRVAPPVTEFDTDALHC